MTEQDRWTEVLAHNGRRYSVTFVKRPFREGLEVRLELAGKEYSFADLGLGREAIIIRLKEEIDQLEHPTRQVAPSTAGHIAPDRRDPKDK